MGGGIKGWISLSPSSRKRGRNCLLQFPLIFLVRKSASADTLREGREGKLAQLYYKKVLKRTDCTAGARVLVSVIRESGYSPPYVSALIPEPPDSNQPLGT